MNIEQAEQKYVSEEMDGKPLKDCDLYEAELNAWYERFILWLLKQNEELMKQIAPKIGRVVILLESHDQGSSPNSDGHGLSFNAMGMWYKVDNGEWRRCKKHSRTGTLQDIVQAIDSQSNS